MTAIFGIGGSRFCRRKTETGRRKPSPARGTLPVPEVGTQNRYVTLAVCGLLLLAVALVFGQTARHGFVNLDDDRGVYNSPHVTGGLTVSGVAWALIHRSPGIGGWEPLTLVSHAAVWQCCGPNAGVHHLVNVLLQAASAVLLFLVLRSMTGRFWPTRVGSGPVCDPSSAGGIGGLGNRKKGRSERTVFHAHPVGLRELCAASVFLCPIRGRDGLLGPGNYVQVDHDDPAGGTLIARLLAARSHHNWQEQIIF